MLSRSHTVRAWIHYWWMAISLKFHFWETWITYHNFTSTNDHHPLASQGNTCLFDKLQTTQRSTGDNAIINVPPSKTTSINISKTIYILNCNINSRSMHVQLLLCHIINYYNDQFQQFRTSTAFTLQACILGQLVGSNKHVNLKVY